MNTGSDSLSYTPFPTLSPPYRPSLNLPPTPFPTLSPPLLPPPSQLPPPLSPL